MGKSFDWSVGYVPGSNWYPVRVVATELESERNGRAMAGAESNNSAFPTDYTSNMLHGYRPCCRRLTSSPICWLSVFRIADSDDRHSVVPCNCDLSEILRPMHALNGLCQIHGIKCSGR